MTNPQFNEDVETIRNTYHGYREQNLGDTLWAPFLPVESALRSEQLRIFASLLYRIGRHDLAGWRVLDFGCARGRHSREFLDMRAAPEDIYAVDLDEPAILEARRRSPNLSFTVSNGSTLDFPDGHFDLVTAFCVFSAIGNRELRTTIAQELLRVLKPGGYFFWWDMLYMCNAAGGHDAPNVPPETFTALPANTIVGGAIPKPSDGLRGLKGMRKWVGPMLDRLGWPRTHSGILFGPKA